MWISENPLHPALLRLDAERLSAEKLDAALMAHPRRGFTCVVDESDACAAKLLASGGFVVMRRTVEGGWRGEPAMPLPDFEHGTLAQRPGLTKLWLAAHRQHYFATHGANPPAALDAQSWDELFLGDDFLSESAFFILDGSTIAAFSSLRKVNGNWELAWFGTTSSKPSAFAPLNTGLVALESAYLAAQEIPSALGEFDSTNPDAEWRLARYALTNPIAFQTYHLIR